jgi:hypothetical protein
MQPYDNTNSGILTINDKGDNPNRPDRKGSINVEGVEYWVSGWIKDGKEGSKLEGQKYMSLKLEPKEKSTVAPKPAAPAPVDDDIPF